MYTDREFLFVRFRAGQGVWIGVLWDQMVFDRSRKKTVFKTANAHLLRISCNVYIDRKLDTGIDRCRLDGEYYE